MTTETMGKLLKFPAREPAPSVPLRPRSPHQTDAERAQYLATHASLYAKDAGVRAECASDLPALTAAVEAARRAKRGEGAKYREGATLAEIKRGLTADIAAAVKAGTITRATYKVTAHKSRGSMCRPHVDVEVTGLPYPVMNPEKREHMLTHGGSDNGFFGSYSSKEVDELRRTLQAMIDAYGFDRSDTQSDYFHYAFNSGVTFPGGEMEYEAAQREGRERAVQRSKA